MEYALNILIERRDRLYYALEEYKNNVEEFDENNNVVLENRRKYNSCIEAIKILTDNKETSDANLNIGCVSERLIDYRSGELESHQQKYLDDCKIIQASLDKIGIKMGLKNCLYLWSEYSDSLAASWLFLPDNADDIYECVKPFLYVR